MTTEKHKILLIDDELSILVTFRIALAAAGYAVETQQSPADGLRSAMEGEYAAIVVDNRMPEMTGIDLIKELRSTGCTTPVLLMSASDSPIDKKWKPKLDPVRFESKPLTPPRLRSALSALVRNPAPAV